MRRQTIGSTGRRGTVIAASAAVLCLGGTLTACAGGTGDGDGYAAVGAAAGPERTPEGAGAPSGRVTLIPLDEAGGGGPKSGGKGTGNTGGTAEGTGSGPSGRTGTAGGGSGGATGPGSPDAPAGASGGRGTPGSTPPAGGGTGGSASGGTGGSTGGGTSPGAPSTTPGTPTPPTPAVLRIGTPERTPADERWCENVSVEFRNTGGSPARSGTVTFATHIIGALGVDWATIESTQPLPAPIDAGAVRKKTYTVCVDAWRVPLGMRVETQDVTAVWK
ncbi:hypothetical protein PUR49_27060 [Streptomyces sp. BE147]|uniref:hypothetical protein n=1 Tax=Streptomyces sp. BE147 TaxID=3002524 RepID=UPI002E78929B|nr:hypothetical protein [Streptomyces sp. BE147]MEE1740131.1 hypothetical protein [Streptomyces sp. BE147]